MGAMREGGAIHTEGEWFAGKGSWVATANPIDGEIGRDNDPYYGGHLIGESISSCNIPIISAAPDMFKALLAVKQKLHFVGMPGEKVCKVTGKSDWSDEIRLIEAALTKAVTRVPVPVEVVPEVPTIDVGEGWRVIEDDETFIAGDEHAEVYGSGKVEFIRVEMSIGRIKSESSLCRAVCRRRIEPVERSSANDGELVDAEFEVLKREKPPLGITPRKIWLEQRRDGIYDAIARSRATGEDVNRDWLSELVDLEYDLQEVLSQSPARL